MNSKMPQYINLVFKPIDDICNLNCKYCHEKHDQSLLSYKGLTSIESYNKLSILRWFPTLLKELKMMPDLQKVNFCWHGGEPLLLPYEFYEYIVKEQKKALGNGKIKYENILITNGINMDINKIKWLEKLDFSLSLSCDGPEYEHNQERFHSVQQYQIFENNLSLVNRESKAFSLHMVINKYNIKD